MYFSTYALQERDGLTNSVAQLPLVIRERDTEYQFYRLVLYSRLLQVRFKLFIF